MDLKISKTVKISNIGVPSNTAPRWPDGAVKQWYPLYDRGLSDFVDLLLIDVTKTRVFVTKITYVC